MKNKNKSFEEYLEEELNEIEHKKNAGEKINLGLRIKALIAAGVVGALAVVGVSCNKNKQTRKEDIPVPTEEMFVDNINMGLMKASRLGIPLEDLEKEAYMQKLSGNFDINEVVTASNGTLWASPKDLENSKNIGKVSIDTKGETLEITKDSNGNTIVKDKNVGYEIKDENGKVIESGNVNSEGIPSGYKQIKGSQNLIKEGYTVVDKDYYNNEGEVIISKGSVMTEERASQAEKELPKSKEQASEKNTTIRTVEEKTSTIDEIIQGLVNEGVPVDVARSIVLGDNKNNSTTTKVEEPATVRQEEPTTKKVVPTTEPTAKEVVTTVPTTQPTTEPTTKEVVTTVPTTQPTTEPEYKKYGFKNNSDFMKWLNGEQEFVLVDGVMVPDSPEYESNAISEEEYQQLLDEGYQKTLTR